MKRGQVVQAGGKKRGRLRKKVNVSWGENVVLLKNCRRFEERGWRGTKVFGGGKNA